ncbi:HAMP domain-containing sensor histidine kinase [Sphingobacterium sp. Lzh-3]|uniref:sensor histidine kinase n=1 Tax=unclassified Sphingobacterium TaxID=2609468 RepID=UPI0029545228|nr:HAMP domain-containing sensor histidine kinase [Sphingobacterium sp. UGAL515B_05]WON93345.1 HAMP domain-containing histidine kinase [Sphingobacterium sp. UGAL515B_05]
MNQFRKYWIYFSHIGAHTDMSYIDFKRVYMINLIALLCLFPTIFFSILNLIDHRYILSAINFSNSICAITVLFLQYNGKYNSAKATLLTSNSVFFFAGALLYKNGGEYFLLCTLIVSMLMYDNRRVHIILCIIVAFLISLLYLLPDILPQSQQVPRSRSVFNIINALIFMVVAVNFFLDIIYKNMKKIEHQRHNLESMNRDKEKIFSIIAHDIKSPFANLEALVFMFRNQMLNNTTSQEYIQQIYQQITQQNQALDDLLQWGSSNMQGMDTNASTLLIKPMIQQIIKGFKDNTLSKQLKINIDIPDNTQLIANRDHTIIILRNLISNAIKFSYVNGNINIYSSMDELYTHIHIQDEGIGINPSKSAALFNEIQQKSFGTEEEPGSGVGLVLCKDLIERNKGIVNIQSTPNKGSIFTVGLPSCADQLSQHKEKVPSCC